MLRISVRDRRLIAVTFFFLYLAVQVALPIRALWVPGQARWAWQMYTSVEVIPKAWVDAGSGLQPIDVTRYLWQRRGLKDLGPDAGSLLEEHLCDVLTEAEAVRLQGRSIRRCN